MSSNSTNLTSLLQELQNEQSARKLEDLAAALLSHLLDVPITVAGSGSQWGSDAGSVGQRRLRVECKRYRENSRLQERELLGEIEQALTRDDALEAWILVATCTVKEQLRHSLDLHGERRGVPILVIDWAGNDVPPLAALCAANPDIVEKFFSSQAGTAARALASVSVEEITRLKRNLESWCLGFKSLRQQSHYKLDKIWNSPRESNSALGQNAAGGSQDKRVKRISVHNALDRWWQGPAHNDAPAVVIGLEGTGKTWATLDWLVASDTEQPIVLIVPSSAVDTNSGLSESNLRRFLAERLRDVTGVRDSQHWLYRLDRLFNRPEDEGPILTIFFDGLNQEQSVPWLRLLKVLQGETFEGRVRVIVSTRKHHFEDKLSKLSGLIVSAVLIEVNRYDTERGGELDQMLRYEGLVRNDLHPDVLEMARTPRLFDLVVRFKERLVDSGQITIHRLLWEYGRDTLGVRAGSSFSEGDWEDWLKDIARKHRDGFRSFSTKSLSTTVSRPDLTENEVFARLSDIIDGRFATRSASGDLQLAPAVVAHALGIALLDHLNQVASATFETLDEKLEQWLEPIAALDQPAEILRAAVSILIEEGRAEVPTVPGVLLTAWLQSQNVSDTHRWEIVGLARNFPDALLDAIEHSESRIHDSARSWAVKALREIPRSDRAAFATIIARASGWLRTISRDIDTRPNADKDHNKWRSDQLRQRIGTDSCGPITVVGLRLDLVDQPFGRIKAAIPAIIEGFPLAGALPIFEVAAVELAVMGRSACWESLKWTCLFNEVDADETVQQLRDLSEKVNRRNPESGVHLDLPKRIAALLLWLTGEEADEETAVSLEPYIGHVITYEKDYLPQPSRSIFPLERRHAEITFDDTDLSLIFRTERVGDLWLDPDFLPPDTFVAELRRVAAGIDVENLNRHGSKTIDDYSFEQLEPALARCAPDLLADLIRRKLQGLNRCPQESRYWMAINALDHLVLAGESEIAASRSLRQSGGWSDTDDDGFAISQLLLMEIRNLDGQKQFNKLIRADLKYIATDFADVLGTPTPDDVRELLNRYAAGSLKQQGDLLALLSFRPVEIGDDSWLWIEGFRKPQEHQDLRKFAFRILANADLARFGRTLWVEDWSWSSNEHVWVNHYGTDALIEATSSLSFDELAPKLAPWRLLEAVRRRGAVPTEVRLAAAIFGRLLLANGIKELDPGSDLSIDLSMDESLPFSYSLKPRRSEDEAENFRVAMDAEAQLKAYQRSIDIAVSRICEARRSGANLFHAILDAKDFGPVLQHAPDVVEQWLEGFSEPTAEFQRRVRLAEGAFLALCEALLEHDPERGSRLWHVLRVTMTTRYLGKAGVDDLLHMVFRVPDSPAAAKLRKEIIELEFCNTDQGLFDIAIAAAENGKIDWLDTIIREDQASQYAWRRKRGIALQGFRSNNTLPIRGAWPDSNLTTNAARLAWTSARSQWVEACAQHWWQVYLDAPNPAEAYAAWVLLLRSADRRIWVSIQEDIGAPGGMNDFADLKRAHFHLNAKNLKRALKKREEKFDQNFLHRKIERGVGPWI